jgi:N-acetylglutamate synthase-like GNAT family acetyltransferase
MKNPRLTGISSITGKTVYIRHATESDIVTVREYLKRNTHNRSEPDLMHSDVVVAAEEDRLIGFGILEKADDNDAGCVTIAENGKRRGIGASIAHHLMEYSPMKTIYVTAGEPGYFTGLGFSKSKAAPRKVTDAASRLCRRKESSLPLAAYVKR